jgi:hypothetical protein
MVAEPSGTYAQRSCEQYHKQLLHELPSALLLMRRPQINMPLTLYDW